MTNVEIDEVLNDAIREYGSDLQQVVAIEELSELQKEISKSIRGLRSDRAVAEEIADVQIMIEQLIRIYNLDRAYIAQCKFAKVSRLRDRIIEHSSCKG